MAFLDNTGLSHLWDKIKTALSGKLDTTGNAYRAASIPLGQVDSTSTATAFTVTVPGITELRDGVCAYIRNGVVTSASGFTVNVNGLGAKPCYSSMAAATRATTIFNVNYTLLFVYNEDRVSGGCWDLYYGYYSDANSIGYQLRTASTTMPTLDKFYRYRLLFTSADRHHFVPANTSSSTSADTAKTTTQRPIDPFGAIYYYGHTTAINANANPTVAYFWTQYSFALGYSFNRSGAALTLTNHAPVYIKCAPQSDGSAIIDADTPFVQTLPSTADGKIYIFLGIASSATAVELVPEHPVFCYRNGQIRPWTGNEETELPAVTASDDGKVLAVNNGEWSADSPVIVSGTDAQVANAVNDYLTQYGVPLRLSEEIKQALLDCFENVAWINDQGQTYYDALYAALYPPVDVLSISAVFTQGSAVIYDTDDLDTLKQYLVVTATMTDSTTQTVTGYTLSGTLTEGTSTITVSYGGKTTTFNVTVSEQQHLTGYTTVGNPTIDGQNRMTTSDGNFIKTPFNFDNGGLPWELRAKVNVSETNQPFVSNVGFYDIINCVNSKNASTRGILVEFNHSGGDFDYKLNLFASDTANSWNIVSPQQESINIQSLFNGDVYIKAGWTGSAYYIAASADGVTWSNELRHEWTGKTTSIMTGYPIAFGNKRNKAWGYCIYVDSLELDIGGALYWKAVG